MLTLSYLQPSLAEALCIYNFFSIRTDHTLSEVRIGRGLVCHRMAHYVLIRCFLQPSLAEALCGRTISAIFTDEPLRGEIHYSYYLRVAHYVLILSY